jgi:hypothetical protein
VLLPSDTHRKPITFITAVLLPSVTNLLTLPHIIRMIKSRRMRGAGYVVHMGEKRKAYGILMGKPEGKRPQGRPRHWWEDNIKMDLRGRMGWYGLD